MDAQRLALDVPVDHYAAAAVAHVPLRGEILVPGPEVLRVRSAGSGAVSPNRRIARVESPVRDDGSRLAQLVPRRPLENRPPMATSKPANLKSRSTPGGVTAG